MAFKGFSHFKYLFMYEPIILLPEKETVKISYEEILKLRILPSDNIPLPEVVLSFKDVMVMTRKNISCITGKAKVGKTFLLTLLTQNVLQKGEMNDFLKSFLPKGRDKIIYIDTEQSDFHILLILKRIKDFVGENKIDNLMMFNFDAVDIENRRDYTRELIYNTDGVGLVVIDGIADLIYDTNDIKESNIMVSDLRKWSVENNVHILNILHQNPSENSKMRGHLGSILTNKSETVIQITSDKENESIKLVETLQTRNKKPDAFAFEISEDGNPNIIDYEFPEKSTRKTKQPLVTKKDKLQSNSMIILNGCFSDLQEKGTNYADLCDRIRREFLKITGHVLGDRYAKDFLKESIEEDKILYEPATKKYYLGNYEPF